jgi:DNA polymerase III subunit gamma/tau
MAYQVLARKWRPKQFEEVVGQGHVTRTLQNAIKQNKLAHAYLFTGTRGVGKTSIARLFAKAIRCETPKADCNPCLECVACRDINSGSSMDYTEIDGASNNSVDDVRSLIENVQYLPTRGKYKIYVIDEVHMLSVSAFNALLKTLEEPPQHAIFMLATTDPQKLLGTVISRCQRYDFKNVSVDELKAHVEKIAKAEEITFSSARVPQRLAELGKGSVRDTLSIFDQVLGLTGGREVTEESLAQSLGLAGTNAMRDLVTGILLSEPKKVSKIYSDLLNENIDLKKLCDQVLNSFFKMINSIDHQEELAKEGIIEPKHLSGISVSELFWIYESLAKDFTWALQSINPENVVQIILQKLSLRRQILTGDDKELGELPQGKPEAEEVKPEPRQVVKTWDGFLSYLRQTAAATAANLEHGNLWEDLVPNSKPLLISVAFPEDAAVFQEYVEDKDVYARLKNHIADYFEVDIEQVQFRTKLLSTSEKEDVQFKTKVEIKDEAKHNEEEIKRKRILNDPFVKEAESLFSARVDKVILKD